MALTERRPHWRAGHTDHDLLERQQQTDPDARQFGCFTQTGDAAEWLIEQLATRTVEDLGGFLDAADAHQSLRMWRQWEKEYDPEKMGPQLAGSHGQYAVSRIEIGTVDYKVEYRMELCNCASDVYGRCHNSECDRDSDWDSEPGGNYPGYCRWYGQCFRCGWGQRANGGYSHEGQPVPAHRHLTEASLRKLIEGDEHVGWHCNEYPGDDRTKCDAVWRFADESWASRYRLTRAWNGKVTGTQGYAITEVEAIAEAARLNAGGHGFTVAVEPIKKEEQ